MRTKNAKSITRAASSRKLTKKECADVIEISYAFGAEHGVNFGGGDA